MNEVCSYNILVVGYQWDNQPMCIVGLGPWPSLTATVKFHLPVIQILLHLCGKKKLQ